VRAQTLDRAGWLVDDFHIEHAGGSLNVLNAPSPAATLVRHRPAHRRDGGRGAGLDSSLGAGTPFILMRCGSGQEPRVGAVRWRPRDRSARVLRIFWLGRVAMGLIETADTAPPLSRQLIVAAASLICGGWPAVHFTEQVRHVRFPSP
jgi:hypothetical protein